MPDTLEVVCRSMFSGRTSVDWPWPWAWVRRALPDLVHVSLPPFGDPDLAIGSCQPVIRVVRSGIAGLMSAAQREARHAR